MPLIAATQAEGGIAFNVKVLENQLKEQKLAVEKPENAQTIVLKDLKWPY